MSEIRKFTCSACSRGVATVAKPLGPDDVRPGDYVALLRVTYELPSFIWCADPETLPADEPVRISFLPGERLKVYRVKAVCLPFVLVKGPDGRETLDLRSVQLARLDVEFAREATKAAKQRLPAKAKNRPATRRDR